MLLKGLRAWTSAQIFRSCYAAPHGTVVDTYRFVHRAPPGFRGAGKTKEWPGIKYGITCLNSPGTVDADYRGELKVVLINLSNEDHTILHGDRIAQMVVNKVEKVKWKEVKKISATKRGEGGFGHTGKI
jgi:dUTP pyrophosphatase